VAGKIQKRVSASESAWILIDKKERKTTLNRFVRRRRRRRGKEESTNDMMGL
jgi:hypothetical protein